MYNKCTSCTCEELTRLSTGARVRVWTGAQDPVDTPDPGNVLIFSFFDEDTCVATFKDLANTSYLICCQDITAISIVPPNVP